MNLQKKKIERRNNPALLLALLTFMGCMTEAAAQNPRRVFKRQQAAAAIREGRLPPRFQQGYAAPPATGLSVQSVKSAASPAADGKQSVDEKSTAEKDKEKDKEKNSKKKVRGDAPCVSWVKFGVPVRANILCVHGLALNSGSFEQFGKDMSQKGIGTYAIDVRGFGSWMEAKGHTKVDFKDCIEDVKKTLEWLHKSDPNKPVFLLGESMGGAIALHVAAQYPELMKGVISVCSSGDRFNQKKTDLKVFLHALTGPTRKFDIGSKLVEQAAGANEELKQSWQGDELSRMELSPLELMQFQHFMNENHDAVEKITNLPVLMVQGREDTVVKPEGTEELFNELKSADKQLLWVDKAQHLIFENGQFTADTLGTLADWMMKRCPPLPPESDSLSTARAAIESGHVLDALPVLNTVLKKMPNNPEAHLLMGQAQLKLKHYLPARQQLTQAIRLGKGSPVAKEANKYMMMLPQQMLGPASTKPLPAPLSKPSVLIFNASWCRPCQDMNNIVEQAKRKVGDKVEFKIIDVDDEANTELLDRYTVGPVPTTVFITADGTVAGYQVGYDGVDGMLRGMQKILQVGGPQQIARPKRPGLLKRPAHVSLREHVDPASSGF